MMLTLFILGWVISGLLGGYILWRLDDCSFDVTLSYATWSAIFGPVTLIISLLCVVLAILNHNVVILKAK